MPNIQIERPVQRRGLFISTDITGGDKSLIFPLDNIERGELDELVRAMLSKWGITDEATVNAIIDKVEQDYETRILVSRARAELRRLMAIRTAGGKLMQRGFRKWKPVNYRKVEPKLKTFTPKEVSNASE